MNAATIAPAIEPAPTPPPPLPAPPARVAFPWTWTAMACALLIVSGGVRIWQARRLAIPSAAVGLPPFSLETLPTTLGNWKILEGSERKLDPEVAQVAGCTAHLIRDYFDAETGCVITILIGYGAAEWVNGHSPEICFPASGYQPAAETIDRELPWADGKGKSRVRSGIYASAVSGGRGSRLEAYYALRHRGKWDPEADFKTFRREPAMYRILLQRRVLESERRDQDNPSEQFLAALFPEFERKLAEASEPAPKPR